MRSLPRVWTALVCVGLIAAGAIAARRLKVENDNRAVQIIVDWNEIETLAYAGSGTRLGRRAPADVLRELRAHGVNGVAVSEMSLADLRDSGRIAAVADPRTAVQRGSVAYAVADMSLAAQIAENLRRKLGPDSFQLTQTPGSPGATLILPDSLDAYRGVGLGLPVEAVVAARDAGVEVVARLTNYPGASPASIDFALDQVSRQLVRTVVFAGMEVLGNKALIVDTAAALRRHHLNFGYVEFGKQRGDAELARRMHGQVVRVHSITDTEMALLTMPEAVDRFVKAARERDIRLAYVRLYVQPSPDSISQNIEYLDGITRGLARVGLTTGPAQPFAPLFGGRLFLALAGIGVVAGTVLLLTRLLVLPPALQIALFVVGAAGSTALLGFEPTLSMGRKGLAFLAALVFPTLALYLFGDTERRSVGVRGCGGVGGGGAAGADGSHSPTLPHSHTPTLRAAVAGLARMSGITLVGAFLIVGLLGDTRYILKYDQFMGIKAAHVGPLFALAVILVAGMLGPAASWRERWDEARRRVLAILENPIYVWQAAALAVGFVFLAMVVLRSGNDPGVGVSATELKFRALMDRILYVRPRTKEFLVGHPAMVLALWAGYSGRRYLWAPLLLIGAIGQVSLLNTFCHIHTPLMVSLLRAANGLVLGTLFGVIGVWVLARVLPVQGGSKEQGAGSGEQGARSGEQGAGSREQGARGRGAGQGRAARP